MTLVTNFKISHQYYRIEEGKLAEIIHSLIDIEMPKILTLTRYQGQLCYEIPLVSNNIRKDEIH